MAGMIAMSAAPVRKASAHCEGTVKERSYFPCNGPCVKPQTNGAVFRYCTMETRSFFKGAVLAQRFPRKLQYSRRDFAPRKHAFDVKLFGRFAAADFGGVKHVEAFALADGPVARALAPARLRSSARRRARGDAYDCGENRLGAKAARLLQSLLGRQARQAVAGNR